MYPVIDTESFQFAFRRTGRHGIALGNSQANNIGEIVLALLVLVVYTGQVGLEIPGRGCQQACVDLLQQTLFIGRVFLFHNADQGAFTVA